MFDKTIGANLTVGDIISLSGSVSDYRADAAQIPLTEITKPNNVHKISGGNKVVPLVIGKDTPSPPTEQYTSLDNGDIFQVPGNASQLSKANPVLKPEEFGLDFWESLVGELVTIEKPTAISKPNNFGDTWVVGDWEATGRNKRGGLTMLDKGRSPLTLLFVSCGLTGY